MSARFVSTTRLSNVVQMITLARQSGILRALRGHGAARELGQIRFVDGQPIAALYGQMTGQAALVVLMNWGECVYAFDEGPQVDASEGDWSWPSGSTGSSGSGMTSPLPETSAGSWPSYAYGSSPPFSSSPAAAPLSPTMGISATPPSMLPPFGSLPPAGAPPDYALPSSAPGVPRGGSSAETGAYGPARYAPGSPAIATMPDLQAITPEVLNSVPVRTAISAQVDQLPLDRRERMVLLLVDGPAYRGGSHAVDPTQPARGLCRASPSAAARTHRIWQVGVHEQPA